MPFYDLSKPEREQLVKKIHRQLTEDLSSGGRHNFLQYFSDQDTYIRKAGYLSAGRIYKSETRLRTSLLLALIELFEEPEARVRQTVINTAGEIGMHDFEAGFALLEKGLFDSHYSVMNAVIGSLKKAGEKNPVPVLAFAAKHLHHPDREIRRQIVHGIELRGRTHPQEVLPLLQELEYEKTARVRNMIIHVIGQISYKKGCIETVMSHLKGWKNRDLVKEAIAEILDVHERYKDFSVLSPEEAREYVKNFR
jgi:hypothetical protein